jgi:hypothetical protein
VGLLGEEEPVGQPGQDPEHHADAEQPRRDRVLDGVAPGDREGEVEAHRGPDDLQHGRRHEVLALDRVAAQHQHQHQHGDGDDGEHSEQQQGRGATQGGDDRAVTGADEVDQAERRWPW